VVLELGANDALRGIDPAAVRANLEPMIGRIQASGAKLLLLGMKAPPNWGEDYQRAFDRIYPELAHAHNVPLVPFFLDGVAMDPNMNQADGLHPNEKGVAIMVDHIAPEVAKLLSGSAGGRS
jgi:acyl-CoA thioesterase-1